MAVVVGIVAAVLPRPAAGAGLVSRGASDSDRAAALPSRQRVAPATDGSLRDGWKHAFAYSDTTGYEFPDDEIERSTWDVIKEVTLWVVVAGFVAFFIIKVFLEGDDPEQEDPGNGKPIPGGGTVNAYSPWAFADSP